MNILDRIVERKKIEVEKKKKEKRPVIMGNNLPDVRDFESAVKREGITLIAEIKRMSPSSGIIKENFIPEDIARSYERNGAGAISVLTDSEFFGGIDELIPRIKKITELPILRKEFIIDEYQIYESRWLGADAILLIAGILESNRLRRFLMLAEELGIKVLLEVHSEEELFKALSTGGEIIGINNRNLNNMEVNIENSLRLKSLIPDDRIIISESGIKNKNHVSKLRDAGFDGILVGESIMMAENPENKVRELMGESIE